MTSGYDEIYRGLLPRLATCDFRETAGRLGGEMTGDGVCIRFLGRDYFIDAGGIEPKDGCPADANTRSVLVYYITSPGAGEPTLDFAPLNRFTGLIEGRNTLTAGIMNLPLIREFGSDYAKFRSAAAKLGGNEQLSSSPGKHIWNIYVLPKILSQIIFYEADEEFPADIQIRFDLVSRRFLEFECLAVLTGCMVKGLLSAG